MAGRVGVKSGLKLRLLTALRGIPKGTACRTLDRFVTKLNANLAAHQVALSDAQYRISAVANIKPSLGCS